MQGVMEKFVFGFFAVIALMIIFVRAGQYGGRSGGQQSADILYAGGSTLGNLGKSLNGG
jgi:hypothetical protein